MKGTMLTVVALFTLTLAAAGAASAAENPGAGSGDAAGRQPAVQEMADCHGPQVAAGAALPFEAPWISLALANADSIALSAEQTSRLEGLRSEFQQAAAQQQHTIATAESALEALLAAEPLDLKRVGGQLEEIAALRATLRLRRIEALAAGRAVLSAEQRANLQALFAQRGASMHGAALECDPGTRQRMPPAGRM